MTKAPSVDDLPSRLAFEATPPDHLFHYTDLEGVKGIFTSRTLWMSKFTASNDISEIQLAIQHFQGFVQREASEHTKDEGDFLREAADQLESFRRTNICLASFCEQHDLVLVADEIHCDLIFDELATPHFSALNLPETLASRTITLLSPSKTWNIAGLGYAFAVIPDDTLRRRFAASRGHTLCEISALAYYAAESAYRDGEPWRQQLMAYLKGNRDALVEFIRTRCPTMAVAPAEATYLAWIDARGLDVGNPAQHFEKKAGLFLSDGTYFGWPGWIRFNFGCPRAVMLQGLEKLAAAL